MDHAATDFASTIGSLLGGESLIRVRPAAPQIDVSGLVELLHTMANKIEQQETELMRQRDLVDTLVQEVTALRATADDSQVLRRDTKRLVNEVENLTVQHRVQNQRLDRLRSDVDELSLEQPIVGSAGRGGGSPVGRPLNATVNSLQQSQTITTPTNSASPQRTPFQQQQQPISRNNSSTSSVVASRNQQRPVVGIELVDSPHGVLVQSVRPGGPASLAGMQPGDVIVACNSVEVNTRQDFLDMLEQATIGQSQDVTYYRENQRKMTRMYVVSSAVDTPQSPDRIGGFRH